MEVKVVIDLAPMRKIFYRMDPLLPLEEVAIENFSTLNTMEHSTLGIVIDHAINAKFNTKNMSYDYSVLGTFYNAPKFLNTLRTFIDILTSIINREVDPYYNSVYFSRVVTKTDTEYLVEFIAEYIWHT